MPSAEEMLARARAMRREPTDAERVIWRVLRDRRLGGLKWRRQMVLGRYIADFVCLELRLIVEVDGSQHAENAYDAERDAWLAGQGFQVLRFWNGDVLRDTDGVADTLLAAVGHG